MEDAPDIMFGDTSAEVDDKPKPRPRKKPAAQAPDDPTLVYVVGPGNNLDFDADGHEVYEHENGPLYGYYHAHRDPETSEVSW